MIECPHGLTHGCMVCLAGRMEERALAAEAEVERLRDVADWVREAQGTELSGGTGADAILRAYEALNRYDGTDGWAPGERGERRLTYVAEQRREAAEDMRRRAVEVCRRMGCRTTADEIAALPVHPCDRVLLAESPAPEGPGVAS